MCKDASFSLQDSSFSPYLPESSLGLPYPPPSTSETSITASRSARVPPERGEQRCLASFAPPLSLPMPFSPSKLAEISVEAACSRLAASGVLLKLADAFASVQLSAVPQDNLVDPFVSSSSYSLLPLLQELARSATAIVQAARAHFISATSSQDSVSSCTPASVSIGSPQPPFGQHSLLQLTKPLAQPTVDSVPRSRCPREMPFVLFATQSAPVTLSVSAVRPLPHSAPPSSSTCLHHAPLAPAKPLTSSYTSEVVPAPNSIIPASKSTISSASPQAPPAIPLMSTMRPSPAKPSLLQPTPFAVSFLCFPAIACATVSIFDTIHATPRNVAALPTAIPPLFI
ncbi:hypothetical protein BD779DRAFT_1593711 [Infundibulicybe gibba]|nr:hypothetical protein BD779DRAFT_1593711 [Infundibulicybe gibba]